MAEVEKWFAEIDEAITKYKGAKANDFHTQQSNSILIVNNLISILKSDPKNENTDLLGKVNQIVDKASEIDNGRIWGYAYMEKECDLLLDFLKELVERKCMDKVDQIFHCGEKPYPIVNFISRIFKEKFDTLFKTLPEDYQKKLEAETVTVQDGDKEVKVPVLGGYVAPKI